MKICSICGKALADTAKFCFECGGAAREEKKLCQNCQSELLDGVKFCSECGAQVGTELSCKAANAEGDATSEENIVTAKENDVTDNEGGTPVEAYNAPIEEKCVPANECSAPIEENVAPKAVCVQTNKVEESPKVTVDPKKNRVNGVLSFAFAICSLASGVASMNDIWKTVFLWFPSMVVFLVLSKCFLRKYFIQSGEPNKFTKASEILTKIALPVGVVFTCLCVLLSVISFVGSETFASLVNAITAFFSETVFELPAK